jgi:8-oxo-dGTP diphosphatase
MAGFQVTVDLVVLTIRVGALHVLLVRRKYPPYRGRWALPGGFVNEDEDLGAAAARELAEETSLRVEPAAASAGRSMSAEPGAASAGRSTSAEPAAASAGRSTSAGHLEQLGTYGAPRRDPRGRVVTVAYLALVPDLPSPSAGTDAADAAWVCVAGAGRLAFDHGRILADGVERARAKLEYTSLAAAFCPPLFTVAQLREVYEAVWGAPLDPRNFHRKVTATDGFLEPVGRSTGGGRGRPAQLFRRGDAEVLYPPLLRPPAAS